MANEKPKKKIKEDLRDVVGTLTDDIVQALDIKEEKKILQMEVDKLKDEELELKNVIATLKKARDKLQAEVKVKESEEERLKSKIHALKDDKTSLESERTALTAQVNGLERERKFMENSLEKTNDLLMRLRHEIEEFDEEIRK